MYKLMSQIPWVGSRARSPSWSISTPTPMPASTTAAPRRRSMSMPAASTPVTRRTSTARARSCPRARKIKEEDCKPVPGSPPMKVSNHTLLHEAAHAEDDGIKFMEGKWGVAEFGGWQKESPASIAKVAAPHLKFDEDWIRKTLEDKGCKPPEDTPKPPKGVSSDVWMKRRDEALTWCQTIRSANGIWWNGGECCQPRARRASSTRSPTGADAGRSYKLSARKQGIHGYQFRAPGEWFAELYAAYYSKKLKPSHPAMSLARCSSSPRKSRLKEHAHVDSSAAPASISSCPCGAPGRGLRGACSSVNADRMPELRQQDRRRELPGDRLPEVRQRRFASSPTSTTSSTIATSGSRPCRSNGCSAGARRRRRPRRCSSGSTVRAPRPSCSRSASASPGA